MFVYVFINTYNMYLNNSTLQDVLKLEILMI